MTRLFSTLLFYLCVVSCSDAQNNNTGIKVLNHDKGRLLINNLDLDFSGFLNAYLSDDISQRRLAEMYLIGVLDTNEGKLWCGYGDLLPITLVEFLHGGLVDKNKEPFTQQRASDVILSFMSKFSPCKEPK